MSSYNKVILIGNLTRDPEIRYTPKGQAVAKVGLAVNRKWKGEDGQEREEASFIDVDAFGKQAELIAQYLKKGAPLFVDGRLKMDTWDDKESGKKQSKLKVVLEGFQFLGGGQKEGGPVQPPHTPRATRPAAPATATNDAPPQAGADDAPF